MQNNKNFIRQVHVKQKIFNRSNKVASEEWIFQYFYLNLQLICVLAHYCTKSYNNEPKKKRTTIRNGENQN